MKDKDFLKWIYNRLIDTHQERENYDYMKKFKRIIDNIEEEPTNIELSLELLQEIKRIKEKPMGLKEEKMLKICKKRLNFYIKSI